MLRNLGSIWLRTIITIVVVFVSKPFVVDQLGVAENDIWVTLNLIVGWLALVAAGVPMSTTRQIARRSAVGDLEALTRTAGSALAIYALLALAAVALGAALYPLYDQLYLEAKVAPELHDAATWGYSLLVLFGAVTFSAQLHYGIFNGHQDFVRPNAVMTSALVGKLLLFIAILPFWPSVTGCCAIALFIVLAEYGVGRWLVRRRYPQLRISLRGSTGPEMRELASFSLYALLLNLGIKLSFTVNGLVLAKLGEPGTPTLYDSLSSPIFYLLPLVVAVGQVMIPRVARWKELGEEAALRAAFLKWAKLGTGLGLVPLIWLVVQAEPFLNRWMRPAFEDLEPRFLNASGQAMTVLVLGTVLFLPARGLAMPVLMALGKPRAPAALFVAGGILNLIASLMLIPQYGLVGAAIATGGASTLLGLCLLEVAGRELGLGRIELLRYVMGRNLLAAAACALALHAVLGSTADQSWITLILSGIATTALYGLLWVLFVARGDPAMPELVRAPWRALRRG